MNGSILKQITGFRSLLPVYRNISVTSTRQLKKLVAEKDEAKKEINVSAIFVDSPHEAKLLPAYKACIEDNKKFCPECTLGLDVKHTDVLILSQYITREGLMLPKRITGLCSRQQKRISSMVTMAQKAGLMINMTPDYCNKDPKKRFAQKACNTYFDERTIVTWRKKPTEKK